MAEHGRRRRRLASRPPQRPPEVLRVPTIHRAMRTSLTTCCPGLECRRVGRSGFIRFKDSLSAMTVSAITDLIMVATLTPAEAVELLAQSDVQLVDVRDANETAAG